MQEQEERRNLQGIVGSLYEYDPQTFKRTGNDGSRHEVFTGLSDFIKKSQRDLGEHDSGKMNDG